MARLKDSGVALQRGERARDEADAEGPAGQALDIERQELDGDRDAEGRDREIVGAQAQRDGADQRARQAPARHRRGEPADQIGMSKPPNRSAASGVVSSADV